MIIDIRTDEGKEYFKTYIKEKGYGLLNGTKRLVVVSGFFDPIHKGHIEYIQKASELGRIIVILNTDEQAVLKKGKPFMKFDDRSAILNAIKNVEIVVPSIDEDMTVCKTLEFIRPDMFAKGGDRFATEIPEADICRKDGIIMVDSLGMKIQSSSTIIREANA